MNSASREFKSEYFEVGPVLCSKGVHEAMKADIQFGREVEEAMLRYCRKDWGMLSESDCMINEEALDNQEDLYLLGAYVTSSKGKINIITCRMSEYLGDNVTTVCFPFER